MHSALKPVSVGITLDRKRRLKPGHQAQRELPASGMVVAVMWIARQAYKFVAFAVAMIVMMAMPRTGAAITAFARLF